MPRIELEVDIDRPPEEVFSYLSNPENMPEWYVEFAEVERLEEGPLGKGSSWRFVRKRPRVESTSEWVEFEPNRRLAWHGPPAASGPGSVEPNGSYTLTLRNGGTHVHAVFEPRAHGIVKLTASLMAPIMARNGRKHFQRLKQILEDPGRGSAG